MLLRGGTREVDVLLSPTDVRLRERSGFPDVPVRMNHSGYCATKQEDQELSALCPQRPERPIDRKARGAKPEECEKRYERSVRGSRVVVHTYLYRAVKRIMPILFVFAGLILMLVALRWGYPLSEGRKTSTEDGSEGTTPTKTASRTLDLTPSGDSGVSGSVLLANVPYGVEIVLKVQNLPAQLDTEHLNTGLLADPEYPAYVHEGGTCAEDRAGNSAPIKYTLYPIAVDEQGAALSMTRLSQLGLSQLLSGPPKYVDVHIVGASGNGTPTAVTCADLPQAGATTGAGLRGGVG